MKTGTLKLVRDLQGEQYSLESNSQDILATLEMIGQSERYGDAGCLIVDMSAGEIEEVWLIETAVPWLQQRAELIFSAREWYAQNN
jgi:hypothetical protein